MALHPLVPPPRALRFSHKVPLSLAQAPPRWDSASLPHPRLGHLLGPLWEALGLQVTTHTSKHGLSFEYC